MATNPLMGPNDSRFGTRFPDMTDIYTPKYVEIIEKEMKKLNITVRKGVYSA